MPPGDPPPSALAGAASRAVHEIDRRAPDYDEALMWALLRAAWPSLRAQNQ